MKRSKIIGIVSFALIASLLLFFRFVLPSQTAHITGADGTDYRYVYYPAISEWVKGERLYTSPHGFFYPPHAAWMLGLMMVPGYDWGLAILRTFTVAAIIGGVIFACQRRRALPIALTLAMVNFQVIDMVFKGQFDAVPLLGVIIGGLGLDKNNPWLLGASYPLLAAKPPNFLPVGIYLFIASTIRWRNIRRLLKSLLIPTMTLLLTFIFHPTWLTDWMINYRSLPPSPEWPSTLWRAGEELTLPGIVIWGSAAAIFGISAWLFRKVRRDDIRTFIVLILVTTYMLSPYAVSYSYSVVLGVVFGWLVSKSLALSVIVWFFTWIPILRPHHVRWLDYIIILVCYIAITFSMVIEIKRKNFTNKETAT
jgi:hypothetical protein